MIISAQKLCIEVELWFGIMKIIRITEEQSLTDFVRMKKNKRKY